MAFGKRKRVMGPRRGGFKKRRTFRKRRTGSKTKDFNSFATKGANLGFRGRKTSRRTYKKFLWDSTLFKTHYRSIFTTSGNVSTPADDVSSNVFGLNMIRHSPGLSFWLTAGGAVRVDTAGTMPLFNGDIILRGGIFSFTISNQNATDVRASIWLIQSVQDPDFVFEPANVSQLWDPSVSPDFVSHLGKPFVNRTILIEGGTSYTFTRRLNMQKIDQTTYNLEGRSPLIYLSISNVGQAAATTVRLTRSYNLSFSADAIGTT